MQHFAKKNIFAKENFGEKVFKKFKKSEGKRLSRNLRNKERN